MARQTRASKSKPAAPPFSAVDPKADVITAAYITFTRSTIAYNTITRFLELSPLSSSEPSPRTDSISPDHPCCGLFPSFSPLLTPYPNLFSIDTMVKSKGTKAPKPVAVPRNAVDPKQDVIKAANDLFEGKYDVDYDALEKMGRKRLISLRPGRDRDFTLGSPSTMTRKSQRFA